MEDTNKYTLFILIITIIPILFNHQVNYVETIIQCLICHIISISILLLIERLRLKRKCDALISMIKNERSKEVEAIINHVAKEKFKTWEERIKMLESLIN